MSAKDRLERDAALLSPTLTEEEIARHFRHHPRTRHGETEKRRTVTDRKTLLNAEHSDRVSR